MSPAGARVALYVRVSTLDQTVANQTRELEAVAERHGWRIVEIFADRGWSGAKDRRPALDRLRQGIARRDFDLVAAWSVDRLGRSLPHLLGLLGELQAKGVDLYLHQQGLDTSTPAGQAMFAMCGVFAQFERSMIVERVKAGLARARAHGVKVGRPRTAIDRSRALGLLAEGKSLRQAARSLGVSVSTLQRALVAVPKPPAQRRPQVAG